MNDESLNRENLKFTEIEKLAQPIEHESKDTFTGEIGFSRYRMDKILKEYADFPLDNKIHALFEHGIQYTEYCQGIFRAHEYLPSIVASQYRIEILEKQDYFNGAYAIGPYIHYAKPLLTSDELKKEKERLGRTLLVFPSHSIEGLVSNFNFEKFINEIAEIGKDFDTVRICMYYKDVNLKRFKPYQKEGFEVVTAGHFNDYNFTRRLRSIIETSDMTMSNEIGSHLGYCLYLKKPHYLFKPEKVEYQGEIGGENVKLMVENEKKFQKSKNQNPNVIKMNNYFSEFEEKITQEQQDLISYLWGFEHVKTPNELNNIFTEINENYSQIKYYLSGLVRLKDILKGNR